MGVPVALPCSAFDFSERVEKAFMALFISDLADISRRKLRSCVWEISRVATLQRWATTMNRLGTLGAPFNERPNFPSYASEEWNAPFGRSIAHGGDSRRLRCADRSPLNFSPRV